MAFSVYFVNRKDIEDIVDKPSAFNGTGGF
jgi:hypothetical protein